MKIDFYYDPSCPFCWITSRWLIQAQSERDIDITWRPFSLAMKNSVLGSKKGHHAASANAAHRVLRVIEAAAGNVGELYTAFGTQNHIFGEEFTDTVILDVLKKQGLSSDLLKAADDKNYDKAIENSMDIALKIVGNDIGVPTIIFKMGKKKSGYFGPVFQKLPSVTESVKLWDALATLATSEDFYELKRSRPAGGPNTASTAVCIP